MHFTRSPCTASCKQHYGGSKRISYRSCTYNSGGIDLGSVAANDYNVFTTVWDSRIIKWYINDVQYHQVDVATWYSGARCV